MPLVVIGQDPEAVFLSKQFVENGGKQAAETLNDFWQEGLHFYASLSADSRSVVATGTGMNMVVWDRADLVVEEVLDLLRHGS
ncbi:MAG: hypothetical protein ACT4OP_02080 [Actinomycetota bacterium]